MLKFIFNCGNLNDERAVLEHYSDDLRISLLGKYSAAPLDLTSIEYCPIQKIVILMSAVGNPLPLFWGWVGPDLIVSDSVDEVLKEIKSSGTDISDLDKVGYIESILFDGPLADRTLFATVKKIQSAESVTIDLRVQKITREWRWLPKIQINGTISEEEACAEAKHQIRNLLTDISIPNNGLVLPITGGLDSRLLATLVREKSDTPIFSYTFQRGWSVESWCAKKVAKALGANHSILNLDERCYRDFAKKSTRKSGGLVSAMHTHGIYCCEELLSPELRSLPRMFGFFGDPVTGAMTENVADGLKLSTPESILNKYKNCLYPGLVQKYETEILSDLKETYLAFQQSGSPEHCFHEFWKIQQRQNNLITHLFSYHRCYHSVKIMQPFIKLEFIDFFLSLPAKFRFNRILFKRMTQELYPKVFSLPSMHYPANSLLSKAESFCETLESVFNKFDIKQEIFLSPFKYEQHEKNLLNYLSEDVNKGTLLMKEIFDVMPVKIEYPLWKQGSSAKEHYRFVMLAKLFSN